MEAADGLYFPTTKGQSENGKVIDRPEIGPGLASYAKEMTSLADRLVQAPRPQGTHERQTIRDYARTSEALLKMKNLSDGERDSIRDSVTDVRKNILDADQGQ